MPILFHAFLAVLKSSGFKDKYKLDPNIDLSKAWKLAKYTSYAFGVAIANQSASCREIMLLLMNQVYMPMGL